MAKGGSKRRKKEEPVRRRSGFLSFLVRFCICAVLTVIILYTGLQVMSRTDGFKYLVTEQIRPEMGVPTRLSKARLDASLNLHLEGLICRDPDQLVAPSLYVNRMTINWDWRGLLDRKRPAMKEIIAEDVDLTLAEDLDGVWRPKRLGLLTRIADTFDEKDIRGSLRAALTVPPPGTVVVVPEVVEGEEDAKRQPAWEAAYFNVPVTIRKGTIAWLDRAGGAWAEINRFNLELKPDEDEERRLMHCVFDSGQLITPRDIGLASLEAEFMFSAKGLIMLGYKAPLPQYNASRFRQAAQVFTNQVARVEGRVVPLDPEPEPDPDPDQVPVPPEPRVPGEEGKKLLQLSPEELERYIESVINE